jgi:hypothetical protein
LTAKTTMPRLEKQCFCLLKQEKPDYNDGTLRKIYSAASHAFGLQHKADLATA